MAATIPNGFTDATFRRGYGTYEVALERIGDQAYVDTLETVLDAGYRHLDTAQDYGTEPHVATAIDNSPLTREEVFVATKLHWQNLSYEDAIDSAKASRDRLGVDTIDLLYVHVPTATYDPTETLPALDDLVADGVVDRIGLSNFTPPLLEDALNRLETPVFAHQVEMHPLLHQDPLYEYAVEDDHWLVAFSPLMRGLVQEITELQTIADHHDTTPHQVSLAWLHAKDNVVSLTHSRNPDHLQSNFDAPALELDEEDIALIDGIDREYRLYDSRIDPWNQPSQLEDA